MCSGKPFPVASSPGRRRSLAAEAMALVFADEWKHVGGRFGAVALEAGKQIYHTEANRMTVFSFVGPACTTRTILRCRRLGKIGVKRGSCRHPASHNKEVLGSSRVGWMGTGIFQEAP